MDIYTNTLNYLLEMPFTQTWPEMQTALERTAKKKPRDWQLPVLACEAVGGQPELVVPASAAIACLQISIILIDDMLDADPRGEYHRIGEAAAANLAAAFQAAGLDAISRSEAPHQNKLEALRSLNQMMLTTALGQYLDVQNPADEAAYWHLVRTKSSPFFGAALHVGALLGGASLDVAAQIQELGNIYGEMIQIHDDLGDTMAVPANTDWTLGRAPLPILFAQSVDHPEQARFLELRKLIPDPDALTAAQEILVRSGAVSYCIHHIVKRYQGAIEILANLSLESKKPFESLLDDVIIPVMNLFEEIGVSDPETLVFQSEMVL